MSTAGLKFSVGAHVHAKKLPRGIVEPSERKREVVDAYSGGMSAKEILVRYGVSGGTLGLWSAERRDYERWVRSQGGGK